MGASGAALASLVATAACLTDPPPDLVVNFQPPKIDHLQSQPPEGLITSAAELATFTVQLEVPDPSQPCYFSVYDETGTYYTPCTKCPLEDSVHFDLANTSLNPGLCHTIRFSVGSSAQFCRDDVAAWLYEPSSCLVFDAGALGDGAFPEATTDAPAIVPESGAGP